MKSTRSPNRPSLSVQLLSLCLVSLGASLVGCGSAPQASSLDQQQQRWNGSHPSSYVVEVCGTGFAPGCTVSAVVAGQVVAQRVRLTGNGAFQEGTPGGAEPVGALFARARAAVLSEGDVKLEFDPDYAFVRAWSGSLGSEASGERVACFSPGVADPAACAQ